MKMHSVGLKQFRVIADSSFDACLSYCVFDPETREAIWVDPHLDALEEYRSFLAERLLRLIMVVDTQTHWSHLSASILLRDRFGCEIGMSAETECARMTRPLRSGDSIQIGRFRLEVLQIPGICSDALALAGAGIVLTGGTLWLSSCAPKGFPGMDLKKHWESLQRLKQLSPESSLVLPSYDANDLLFSTLETEKRRNPALLMPEFHDFAAWSDARAIWVSETAIRVRDANLKNEIPSIQVSRLESIFRKSGKLSDEEEVLSSSVTGISIDKYFGKIEEGSAKNAFLDVRDEEEFHEGHIPHTKNFPWLQVGFHLDELRGFQKVYVSCLSGKRSSRVARTLSYLGFRDVVNVKAGFQGWKNAGYEVECSAEEANDRIPSCR
jgi:rhodanese-related sulfurtransferase/glyoxylase-like metal-dependent hydrolase (beta-lactamase superfamily II)